MVNGEIARGEWWATEVVSHGRPSATIPSHLSSELPLPYLTEFRDGFTEEGSGRFIATRLVSRLRGRPTRETLSEDHRDMIAMLIAALAATWMNCGGNQLLQSLQQLVLST